MFTITLLKFYCTALDRHLNRNKCSLERNQMYLCNIYIYIDLSYIIIYSTCTCSERNQMMEILICQSSSSNNNCSSSRCYVSDGIAVVTQSNQLLS